MIADAAGAAGKAATGATRGPRFEQAASHYTSVLELSKNPIRRTAESGRVDRGLQRPRAQPTRQRRAVREAALAEDPADLRTTRPW